MDEDNTRAVWLLGAEPLDLEEAPRQIGEATDWDGALCAFADWCERKERGNAIAELLEQGGDLPNMTVIRQRCMDIVARRYGLDSFPAFTDDWTFTMNKVCPGFCINPIALMD